MLFLAKGKESLSLLSRSWLRPTQKAKTQRTTVLRDQVLHSKPHATKPVGDSIRFTLTISSAMHVTQTLERRDPNNLKKVPALCSKRRRHQIWGTRVSCIAPFSIEHSIAGPNLTKDVGDVTEQRQRDGVADEVVVSHKKQG